MEPSCPLGTNRCIPQEKFSRKPYNKSFIDQVCSFKMAGYWPHTWSITHTYCPSSGVSKFNTLHMHFRVTLTALRVSLALRIFYLLVFQHFLGLILFSFVLFRFILFRFVLFSFVFFCFVLIYFILLYCIVIHFILLYFTSPHFILFIYDFLRRGIELFSVNVTFN